MLGKNFIFVLFALTASSCKARDTSVVSDKDMEREICEEFLSESPIISIRGSQLIVTVLKEPLKLAACPDNLSNCLKAKDPQSTHKLKEGILALKKNVELTDKTDNLILSASVSEGMSAWPQELNKITIFLEFHDERNDHDLSFATCEITNINLNLRVIKSNQSFE